MLLTTVTGVTLEDIPARLQTIFPNEHAYKGVPGGADLTDISTGFMLERVTEVFGLKGFGWNLTWKPEDAELILNSSGKGGFARLKYAEFSYVLEDQEGNRHVFVVPTGGANENYNAAYAEEGARTSALGAALKGMTFQLSIYKGEYDHHDAAKGASDAKKAAQKAPKSAAPAKPAEAQKPVEAPNGKGYTQEQVASAMAAKVPTGIPLAGKTLEEATKDQQFGIFVLKFLAKESQNAAKKWFEPKNVDEEAVVEAAKIVLWAQKVQSSN